MSNCFMFPLPIKQSDLNDEERLDSTVPEPYIKPERLVDPAVNEANKWGDTQLMMAAKKGDWDETRRLINVGAEVNQSNKWGSTALMRAASEGHSSVVQTLLVVSASGFGSECCMSYKTMMFWHNHRILTL